LRHKGETVCDIPLGPLTEDAPLYHRDWVEPPTQPHLDPAKVPAPVDWEAAVLALIAAPDVASKRWIWEQYDRHVMADTLEDSATGADAGIVRVHGGRKALALTSDCTPRYVAANPFEGGKQAVAEAWRNLTAVGALPIAITDNLNFGNPERPEIMGQIARAIDGMAEACRALDFPVVSGNVSLYNETDGRAIPPTPTVGAVGLLADYARRADFASMKAGDALLVVGASHGELGASLYLRELLGREDGAPPPVDLEFERRNGDFVRNLIAHGQVSAVHDLSDGGLAIAAAEVALASGVGVELSPTSLAHAHAFLFGEDQGRYLIATVDPEPIIAAGREAGLNIALAGQAGGADFACHDLFRIPLERLRASHEGWMPAYMAG
jgi:phosphoribosylformylglycinamidine synthase